MKIDPNALVGTRAYMDHTVMTIRDGTLTIEDVIPLLLDPYQPQLNRELTPMEHIESLSIMLAVALVELAKKPE